MRSDTDAIGRTVHHRIEVGDELCISLANGDYYNITVSSSTDRSDDGREVFCGDAERKHLGLVASVEEVERKHGVGTEAEWTVYAYTLPDRAEDSVDKYDIEAIHIVGSEDGPDKTFDELPDDGKEEVEDMVSAFYAARDDLDFIIDMAEEVRDGEITLKEYNERLSQYEVKNGGDVALAGF